MFFMFRQVNSGGSFVVDDKVKEFVIIEENDYKAANAKAEEIGLYFDGAEKGVDCSCCGDRWHPLQSDSDGADEPCLYDEPVKTFRDTFLREYQYVIHYLNGNIETGVIGC